MHTAVVRYVADGQPAMVEGKWGWMGVFQHTASDSRWGQHFTFYRSPRPGHLLAGLEEHSPALRAPAHES